MTGLTIVRNTEIIAAEINHIKDQTRAILLFNSIEIGRRLVEAKQQVSHGDWGQWLTQAVDFSQSTAINHMKIFEEYGSDQLALFGDNSKSQAFGNLSYSQAVALLAVPAEEREQFIEENDVENLSTRELKEAIEARKQLERELKESKEKEGIALNAHQKAANDKKELERVSKEQGETIRKLHADLEKAKASGDDKAAEKAKADLKKSQDDLAKQQKRIKELEQQLKEKPIDVPKIEIKEVTPPAVEQELADLRKKLAKNDNKLGLKYELQFEQIKTVFKEMVGTLAEIKAISMEEYERYRNVSNVLLGEMMKKI